jgi:hypothetical protein
MFNLFSKRLRIARGEVTDIFVYDQIPQKMKVQVVHIMQDCIGLDGYGNRHARNVYDFIYHTLRKEWGQFRLSKKWDDNESEQQIFDFFMTCQDTEQLLDIIDLSFTTIQKEVGKNYWHYAQHTTSKMNPDQAVEELNERFKENGIGYSYIGDSLIRIDSTYIHAEIIKPAISLLRTQKFAGANEEYLKAHEHYRHGRNKECLSECLKAFESTLKVICKEKNWQYSATDTASKLVKICLDNQLIPSFTQTQFNSIQSLLESGIASIRNRLGGHGQGQVPQKVEDEITRYALNLTGSNIVFLVEESGIR